MIDRRALRERRLINEYNELMNFSNDVIRIEPLGNSPYEKYRITFNIRTIINSTPEYRNTTICILTIPPEYPKNRPKISVDSSSMPPPWHVNWYSGGTWCEGTWQVDESLVNFIYRCAKTIQFAPEFTKASYGDSANKEAISFWNSNKNNNRIIPCDKQKLPTIGGENPRIQIRSRSKPKISIIARGN